VSLRGAVLALGGIAVAAGAALLILPAWAPALWLLAFGTLVIVSTACEFWRYRPRGSARGGRWERTGERFEDPTTGERMEVLFDRESGERRYVRQDEPPPGSKV
jgi:membrane protein implicated in regulation of membrane protease activity